MFASTLNSPVTIASISCVELRSSFRGATNVDHCVFREFQHECIHFDIDNIASIFVIICDPDGNDGILGPIDSNICKLILSRLKIHALKKTFLRPDECTHFLRQLLRHSYTGVIAAAIAALELALWDLVSKRDNISIASMAGHGLTDRKAVACYASFLGHDVTPRSAEKLSKLAKKTGFLHSKFAVPLKNKDRKHLLGVIDGIANIEIPVALDAFQSWDSNFAGRVFRLKASTNLVWLEEPVPLHSLTYLKTLTKRVALAYGEQTYNAHELEVLFEHESIETVTPEFGWCCSLPECVRACQKQAERGKAMSLHGAFLPVAITVAPLLGIDVSVEFHFGLELQRQCFFKETIQPAGGCLLPNEGLGWGVSLLKNPSIEYISVEKHS